MSRRRIVIAGVAALTVAVGATSVLVGRGNGASAAGTSATKAKTATARVTTRDLAETQDVQGTLGYGATRDIAFAGHGTVTALPAVGTSVGRGGRVGEVNGLPVTLFFGDRPAWRDLQQGVPDGADI